MADYPDQVLTLMVRLEQLARSADKDLAKIYKKMQKELLDTLDMFGRIDSKLKMKKLRAKLKAISKTRYAEIEARIGDYSGTAAEAAIKVEEAGFTSLGPDASTAVKSIVADQVVSRSLDRNMPGLPKGREMSIGGMLDRFTGNGSVYAANIANKALIEGLSVNQAAAELRKVVNVSNSDSRTMARTAINGAANQARDDMADKLPVDKELWLATLDSSTCPYCAGQDGQCRGKGKGPRPLAHPNCRCVLLYIPDGISCQEMKDDMNRPTRGPDGKSTRNTKYKDYGSWLKTQPEAFQIEILGKARYQLLKDGKISFKKMYLKNGSRKTIKQLEAEYGISKPVIIPAAIIPEVIKQRPPNISYTPKSNLNDVIKNNRSNIPSEVKLAGMAKSMQAEVLQGLNESVVKYGGSLNSIGWKPGRSKSLAIAARSGDYIRYQKTAVAKLSKNPKHYNDGYYQERKEGLIAKRKEAIADPKRAGIINSNKAKLAELEAAQRWAVFGDHDQSLRAISAHEGFHNVMFAHDLEYPWRDALSRNNVTQIDRLGVSEYGSSSSVELWAEVGTAVEMGIEIPESIYNSFYEVLRTIFGDKI